MNATSRAKIINDESPSIIDSKNQNTANQMISRSLNLFGKEQVAERQRLGEQEKPKKTSMSWLEKLSSTSFVKGETVGSDPKIKGSLQDASTLAKSAEKTKSKEIYEHTDIVKPTFADLDQQRRFEYYLKYTESERILKFASHQPLSMTDWEREKEVKEFERAAKICAHMDITLEKEQKVLEEKKKEESKINLDSLSEEDRMIAAAKMKMFGKLTRIVKEWKPAKLVCNRFNIAEPNVGVAEDDKKKKKFSIFDSISWNEMSKFQKGANLEHEIEPEPSTSFETSFSAEEPEEALEVLRIIPKNEKNIEKSSDRNRDEKEIVPDNDKTIKNENDSELVKLETPTANMDRQEKVDLFKSIFLSSSDESESEAEEEANEEKLKTVLFGRNAAELNVERNTSPPRGIFAELDLDSLMKRSEQSGNATEKIETTDEDSSKIEDVVNNKREQELLPDAYGPILPKSLPTNSAMNQKPIFLSLSKKVIKSDEGVWVEKKEKKKSKKEKKKHKHKERDSSRSKSKKKSKKEKKH